MASIGDISIRLKTILKSKFQYRIPELTHFIDTLPIKELHVIYPQLLSHIFGINSEPGGWGLRTTTPHVDWMKFDLLCNFLSPLGPLFRLCYRLLEDQQLKYAFPVDLLPIDICQTLDSGRFPQYYTDQVVIDHNTMRVLSLYLNPFDFYIFHFAAHVHRLFPADGSWDSWNTAYFSLACDYLLHFLPSDPNKVVLPEIPFYTGKAPAVVTLQISNRSHNQSFSLLKKDLIGLSHEDNSSQVHPRNEVWRSETIQQVFIDFWLSTSDLLNVQQGIASQTPNAIGGSSAWLERVRIARCLVKAVHGWSNVGIVGVPGTPTASENESVRRSARKTLKIRAYNLIKVLAEKWPLDGSFRLPLEFWLTFIQPWRYSGDQTGRSLLPQTNLNQSFRNEEGGRPIKIVDQMYKPFISENLPAYTFIFQLFAPRFMRLDLNVPKNAIMLYRVTKVFAQTNLVPMLKELERSLTHTNSDLVNESVGYSLAAEHRANYSVNSWSSSWLNNSNKIYGESMEGTIEYQPLWTPEWANNIRKLALKISDAKYYAEKQLAETELRERENNKGVFASIKYWFQSSDLIENENIKEEKKKVPFFLGSSLHHLMTMFDLENSFYSDTFESGEDNMLMNDSNRSSVSSLETSSQNDFLSPIKAKQRSLQLKYMGDPDLQPIKTSEFIVVVQFLHLISNKINETYQEDFVHLWNRQGFWGDLGREVLCPPCTVHNYRKGTLTSTIVSQDLPPRISLRPLGSQAFIFWMSFIALFFMMLGYSFTYFTSLTIIFVIFSLFAKILLRKIGLLSKDFRYQT